MVDRANLMTKEWAFPATLASMGLGRLTQGALLVQPEASETAESGPWRVFGSYALVWVLGGRGHYRDANGEDRPVQAGDLITVWPTLGHRYGPVDGGWIQMFVVFDGPVFEMWDRSGLLQPGRPVIRLGRSPGYWRDRLTWVIEGEGDGDAPLGQVCRLQLLLSELHQSTRPSETDAQDDAGGWLVEAKALLSAGLSETSSPEAVADALHFSYSTFRRRFAQWTGLSPHRYRVAATIDRARRLMAEGDLNDQQIADELGFSDPQHFSKRFKQFVGRTPRQYRASLR